MNLKTTWILFGTFCLLVGVFLLLQWWNVPTTEERTERQRWLVGSWRDKSSDINRLVIERTTESGTKEVLEFAKQDGKWRITKPAEYKTDSGAVDSLALDITGAEANYTIPVPRDPEMVGLEQPQAVITLYATKEKEPMQVRIGKLSGGESPVYYVNSTVHQRPLAVPKSRLERVFAKLETFRAKELLPRVGFGEKLLSVAVQAPQRKIELRNDETYGWLFVQPSLGYAAETKAKDLADALERIKVVRENGYIDDISEEKLAPWGLKPDRASYLLIIEKKGSDDKAEVTKHQLLVGDIDYSASAAVFQRCAAFLVGQVSYGDWLGGLAAWHARQWEQADELRYYAKLDTDPYAVRVSGKDVRDAVPTKLDDYRDRHIVRYDVKKVDAINLDYPYQAVKQVRLRRWQLSKDSDKPSEKPAAPVEWYLYTDKRAKLATHPQVVAQLVEGLGNLELRDATAFLDDGLKQRAWFGDDPIDLGLDSGKELGTVRIYSEGVVRDKEGKPEGEGEPKLRDESKPLVTLRIGKHDEKRRVTYVERRIAEQTPQILAVPDPAENVSGILGAFQLHERLAGGYYYFRDRSLKSFVADYVHRVEFTRGTTTLLIEKEGNAWKIKKPFEATAANIDALLNILKNMQADKLVTDEASDQDLTNTYQLGTKSWLQIRIWEKPKEQTTPNELVYSVSRVIEKDGPEKGQYYAHLQYKPPTADVPESNKFVFLLRREVVRELDIEPRTGTIFENTNTEPEEVQLRWNRTTKDNKPEQVVLHLSYKSEKEGQPKRWQVVSYTVNGQEQKKDDFKLEVSKLEALLASLGWKTTATNVALLSTERFLQYSGQVPAEYRLDAQDTKYPPALVIEVRSPDKKISQQLIVGTSWEPRIEDYPGLREKRYYYARASTLPEAVFILPDEVWSARVQGPNFLRLP
ncbi:MAG: DUF4340 domain-containing protein [Gemmatales bacterium]|nr:DUF4340 domain-containing protein [Gemmatales bacterium]